jgi:hypothetical protein
MHSNSLFLLSVDDMEADVNDIASEAESNWEYRFGNRLDENNWYKIWGICLNGKTYVRDDEGEPFEIQKTTSEDEDVSDPFRLAMGIAAIDLRLYDAVGLSIIDCPARKKIDEMSIEELLEAITTEVPQKLSQLYKNAAGFKPTLGYEKESYDRYKIARGYELFMNSFIPPFTHFPGSAYDWRCWDCRDNSHENFNEKENVILMVDIHT